MRTPALLLALLTALLTGCSRPDADLLQGYVEGEFVYVAAPLAGQVQSLAVERGAHVKAGDPLFRLDDTPERAARDEAARRVAQAEAQLADARTGQRPTEIAAVEAQLKEAAAALTLADTELARQIKLVARDVIAQRDLDQARATRDQAARRVDQLSANLATARLGSRDAQVVAAEENLRAQQAALAGAEWNLAQKSQVAPMAGLVADVLFRPGDWVGAGRPAVVLLPPQNVKVRTFVGPQTLGPLQPGADAQVSVDGVAEPVRGRVSFIAPDVEYTPPVIYSRDMRDKLVTLVEIAFDPAVAARLHPGQPVDIRFAAP